MKYTMKKTIAFLLTLVMLVNILPVSVLAEQPEEGRRGPLNAPATRSAQGHSVSVNFGRDVYISDEDNVYVLVRQVQTVAFSENDVRQIMCYQIEKVSNSSSFPMVFNNLKVAYNDNLYVTYELNNNTTQVLLCSAPDLQEYRFVGDELQGVTDYSTSYNSNTVQISLTDDKGSSTINIGEVLPNTYTVELKFYQYNSNEPESVSTLGEGTYTIEATDTEGHVYNAEITGSNSIQFYDESDTLVSSLPEITSWAFKKDGDVTDTLGDYEITSITPTVKNGASNTEKVYVFEARVPKHYTVTLDYQDSQGNTPESVTLNDTYTLAVTTTKDVELTAYINTDGTLSSAWSDGKNYILKAKSFQLQDSEGNPVDGKLGNYLVTYPTNMDPDNGIYHISLHEPKTCTASVNVQATLTDNYDYYIVAKKNGRAYAYAQFITTAANLQFTAITRDTPVLDEETTFEVIRVTKDTSVSDGTAFENAAEEDKVTASGGQIDGNKITWNLTTSEDGTSDFAFTVEPNLPEGVFRRVHVNLYNEDGETISDTYETDLAGHKYFVRLYLYEKNEDGTNGQLIGYQNQNSWILPSQIQGIDVDFTNTQFQNVAGSAESLYDGQGITQYDPEQHNIQVRLLQADQYADSQSITNNSFTSVIEGYMFKAAPYGNVTAGGVTTLNLKKAYPASYHVVIQKGEGVDLNRLHNEGLRLYAEANHQNNHKDYYIENLNNLGMNGPAAAELTLTICDNDENKNWTYSQDDFSGNETTKARLVKNFNNANLTYTETPDGALIKIEKPDGKQDVYIVTYPEKTIIDDKETDPQRPKTVYTDYIKIEKIEVSNDYSYTSILGSGVYYGITAQYFDQGGHIQSNFAANKYYPGNIVEPDLAGNGSMIVIADPQPAGDGYYLEIGGSHVDGTDTVVYMGNNGTRDNVRNVAQRDWVHVVPSETSYLNESIVQPIINHGISISNELLQHGVSFDQKTCNIDLLDLPEDATIYLDGDALKDWISKSKDDGLHITKHPNQTIVFNFDTSTDVTLGQYHIRYSRDDDYQVSHSPTGKGDSVNAFMDNLAQHMVFNCNSAKNVTINTCVGMVLVPRSDSYTLINGTSAGWIISNGTVHNDGAEWHSVYSQLPSATKTNLTVGKTVDGNTPAKNQKFTFTLYHLDTSNEWQQVPSPENASNNYNPTQNANGAVSFNNVALADGDAGWNVYKITESGKAQGTPGEYVQNTQTVYAFVNYITVGSTKIATPPIYYITASEDDNEEDTILFKESNFNKLATTLEGAIGSPTGDNVIRLKKMPKPVFENEQKKDGLYFKKRVKGAGNDNDTFTFRVTLESPVENESVNSIVYKLKKSGSVNSENITFTRVEGTNKFIAEVTLKRDQTANIDGILHNTHYIIEEIKVNNKEISAGMSVDGYTIDSEHISQEGTITPGHSDPLEFVNNRRTETHFEIKKRVTGDTNDSSYNSAEEFNFTLEPVGGVLSDGTQVAPEDVPMPEGNGANAKAKAGITTTFGNVIYSVEGTYYYTIKETQGNTPYMHYDTDPVYVKVVTEQKNNVLETTVYYSKSLDGTYSTAVQEITNTYTVLTSIEVEKVWVDNNNHDNLRPASIQVQLYKGDAAEGEAVTLNADNSWKKTWENLDKYADGGAELVYSVKELDASGNPVANNGALNDYYTTAYATTGNKTIITNTLGLGSVKITKIFDGITELPTGFMITNDYNKEEFTALNADTGDGINTRFEWVIENVPVHTVITFTESGEEVGGFNLTATSETSKACDAVIADDVVIVEFRNSYERKTGTYEIEITKKMEGPEANLAPDGDYVFKLTPVDGAPMPDSDEVIVSLKKGEITGSGKFSEITYDECGEYTYEITEVPGETLDMKYSKEKVVVIVTVTEAETELVADASYQDGIDTLVNYYDSAKVSVAVKKLWKDENNSDGLRPTGLRIELLADGEPTGQSVNLNAENNWVGRIDKLPKRKDGTEIVYTWKEPNVVGYTLTGTSTSGSLTTLTNTHEAEKTKVEVKKVWVDSGEHPADVEVQLYADGKALGDAVKLNAGNGWKFSWNNLCRNVRDDGVVREIKYTVAETKIPEGYVAKITGNASTGFVITNTKETGKLVIEKEFDIQIPEEEPEEEVMTTDIEIVKIWDDNNNKDGNRPKSITVHLYAGGEEVRSAKLTAANGWKHTFGELPKFVNGHPITYTVKEDPVRWYVAEIHGYTIRNKYQPEMTSVSVRKVWDDENNKHMFRPTSVHMTLSNGMSVILNEENGWMASITGLPTMVNGKPAEYTWTEQEVIGYELESMETEGTVTTFTNKPWSRPDKPTEGKTPRLPGEEIIIEEYETPLGVDVIINHVGDCFD